MTNKTEARSVLCGTDEITYILTRKAVKNVNMRVKTDGMVCVSASPRVPLKFIDDFIVSHYDFIRTAREKFTEKQKIKIEMSLCCNDGDKLFYLGNAYTLKILHDEEDSAKICGESLVISTYDTENKAYIQKLVRNWYYNRTTELFRQLNKEVYAEFSALYNVPFAEMQIREMKSRWGSCHISDKKIVMNSRLIFYPELSVKYVFCHEYAHFIVPNHSKSFYGVVADIMPDYKTHAERLKNM